jgi:putative tricarboxylic transport membrane protein
MRINDAILGVIIIAVSIVLINHARSFPALPGVPYGPGFFPNIILGFMALAGTILVFRGIFQWKKTGWLSLDGWAKKPRTYVTLAAIVGAHLFYIYFSERLGFLVTSILLLFCLLLWTRGRKHLVSSAVIAICFSGAVYYIFGMVLRVPLSPGLMQGLL